jgi:hypothetical protein
MLLLLPLSAACRILIVKINHTGKFASIQAAQHHLKNPDIMHKIQTLAGAGIIQLR